MTYELVEASLADLDRSCAYILNGVYGAEFGLKGFDYPWLLSSYDWKKETRALDVGCAYSPMPIHLQQTFGCEVWAADDFGRSVDDPFWLRGGSPAEHIQQHPEVKYVLERLGDPAQSSLPQGYFDVVYSLSTLEHVPSRLMSAVWRHMDALLKPGGEMLHGIDFLFPSNEGLRKLLTRQLFDWLHALVPGPYRQMHVYATPLNYLRQAAKTVGFKLEGTRGLDPITMSLAPNVLVENYQYMLNRIRKDKIQDFHFQRFGSLMIRLVKLS